MSERKRYKSLETKLIKINLTCTLLILSMTRLGFPPNMTVELIVLKVSLHTNLT